MPVSLATLVSNTDKLQNQVNASLLQEFFDYMRNNGNSETYQKNNLKQMLHIAQLIGKMYGPAVTFYDIKTKEQILELLNTKIKPKEMDHEEKWRRTWRDYYEKIVYFYRWLYNVRMAKSEKNDLPMELWRTPDFLRAIHKVKLKSKTPYSLSQIWDNKEEILAVVNHETEPVKRAGITLLWDMLGRNHEVCLLKIKNIRLKERYGEGEISDLAKTGSRQFFLDASFESVLTWLNLHPKKNDPEAYLICDPVSAKQISPDKLRQWTYNLRDKIKEKLATGVIANPRERAMLEELASKRKWNPYCLGRHSAISWWTDHEKEGTVKKLAGLSNTTKRLQTYQHRKLGVDHRRNVLRATGLLDEADEQLRPRPAYTTCGKCKAVNAIGNELCTKCSYPLTLEGLERLKAEENTIIDALTKRVEAFEKADVEREEKFKKYLLELQARMEQSEREYQEAFGSLMAKLKR